MKIPPFFLALVIIILVTICLFFLFEYRAIDNSMKELARNKAAELNALVSKERAALKKDMEVKYQSEMILYENMAKKVEEETNKLRKLQSKFNTGNNAGSK